MPGFKRPWIKRLLIAGSALIVSAIALSLTFAWTARRQQQALLATQQTIEITREDLAETILAGGTVEAERSTTLSPENSGKVAELFIRVGDRITQGQVIARMVSQRDQIEVARAEAALAQAQADLAQAENGARPEEIFQAETRVDAAVAALSSSEAALTKADNELARFSQLASQGGISENELDTYETQAAQAAATVIADRERLQEAEAALDLLRSGSRIEEIARAEAALAQAQAQLDTTELQLDETLVRAPFDGLITRQFAEEGDFVTPTTAASTGDGAASTSIAELSSGLQIDAKIPEASIAKLQIGQAVEIDSPAFPNETFEGVVQRIAPRATREESVTFFQVKVKLTTGLDQLRAGMTVRLSFLGKPVEDVLSLPLAALVTEPDGTTGVYLAGEEGGPVFQEIEVGITTGAQVEIVSGLEEGDRVLVEPPPGQQIDGVDNTGGF